MFAPQELVSPQDAIGRICGMPTVGCPPAIPITVAGGLINERAVELFEHYKVTSVAVLSENK